MGVQLRERCAADSLAWPRLFRGPAPASGALRRVFGGWRPASDGKIGPLGTDRDLWLVVRSYILRGVSRAVRGAAQDVGRQRVSRVQTGRRSSGAPGPWCNGSTGVFGTSSPGSNPGGLILSAGSGGTQLGELCHPEVVWAFMTQLAAIILAAGKGTRMNSDLPKVAHSVAGSPMVRWVVEACRAVGCEKIVVVVGHRQEVVREIFEDEAEDEAPVEFAVQDEQLGTGHAVRCAEAFFEGFEGDVLTLCGDGPLLRVETLDALMMRHVETGAAASLATAKLKDPTGYGRIVRDAKGRFAGIVEEKNATAEQKAIREVNPSYYCFRGPALFEALTRVKRNELTGEYYLTDVPGLLVAEGRRVEVVDSVPAEDVLSINTPEQLAEVDRVLRRRLGMMEAGI